MGYENLNKFAAVEIEKAGAPIYHLKLRESVNLFRLIAQAIKVNFYHLTPSNSKEIKQVIETYTDFPNLKELYCGYFLYEVNDSKLEVPGAILARSQLELFSTDEDQNETELF